MLGATHCRKCRAPLPEQLTLSGRTSCDDCNEKLKQQRRERKQRREAKERLDITYIYILIDPRTAQPRYVGMAKNWRRRLAQHLLDARMGRGDNQLKDAWITALGNEGLQPIMLVVWRGHEYEVLDREKETCALLREQGYDLFNASFSKPIPQKLGY